MYIHTCMRDELSMEEATTPTWEASFRRRLHRTAAAHLPALRTKGKALTAACAAATAVRDLAAHSADLPLSTVTRPFWAAAAAALTADAAAAVSPTLRRTQRKVCRAALATVRNPSRPHNRPLVEKQQLLRYPVPLDFLCCGGLLDGMYVAVCSKRAGVFQNGIWKDCCRSRSSSVCNASQHFNRRRRQEQPGSSNRSVYAWVSNNCSSSSVEISRNASDSNSSGWPPQQDAWCGSPRRHLLTADGVCHHSRSSRNITSRASLPRSGNSYLRQLECNSCNTGGSVLQTESESRSSSSSWSLGNFLLQETLEKQLNSSGAALLPSPLRSIHSSAVAASFPQNSSSPASACHWKMTFSFLHWRGSRRSCCYSSWACTASSSDNAFSRRKRRKELCTGGVGISKTAVASGEKDWRDSQWREKDNSFWTAAAALTAAAAAAAAVIALGDQRHKMGFSFLGYGQVHAPSSCYPAASSLLSSPTSSSSSTSPSSPSPSPYAFPSFPAPSTRSLAYSPLHPPPVLSHRRRSSPFPLFFSSFVPSSTSFSSFSSGLWRLSPSAPPRCCGIVGYIGNKEAEPLLLRGLEILQNRGYDSCGISSVPQPGGRLITTKYASRGTTCDSLDILRKEAQQPHAGNYIGIGHTRWATHGSKTDANAHPHHDWRDRVSVVHNGTIDNFAALKQALLQRGCVFRSETDTEVIANLIGWHLDNGAGFEEAVKNAVGEIQGTWGLCVLHKDFPDRLVLARNGSPLLVGAAGGQVFVASEPAALAQHTNQYLMLKDGEIAVVTAEGVGQLEASRPLHFIGKEEKIELSPEPFPHWTVKEIYEQPQALARAMNYGGRIAPYQSAVKLGGLDRSKNSLLSIENLLICGCGTSLYAGMYGELLMQWLGCLHQVRAVDASELELHAFPKEDAGVLFLSQSGETLDTIKACQLAEIHGIRKFSVVNQVGSLLARLTDCGVYVNAGREVAVASTKAFSCQVAVLSLIAAWFFQNKAANAGSQQHSDRCAALMDAIQRLPVYAGMTLNCREACASVAAKLVSAKTIFVLGKGFGFPVALEGALKIKEVGCIHAEGFAAGALKHGPFALIDEKEHTPVIMLVLGDHHAAYMLNAAQQVKARGAHLICITDAPEAVIGIADDVLVVPSNGPLTALLACIPLQLIAYELAAAKGINPDKPRGLAKTVTVF